MLKSVLLFRETPYYLLSRNSVLKSVLLFRETPYGATLWLLTKQEFRVEIRAAV